MTKINQIWLEAQMDCSKIRRSKALKLGKYNLI